MVAMSMIKEKVRRAIQEDGKSQDVISSEMGVSKTVLSQWLNDKYPGDNNVISEKAQSWLIMRDERRRQSYAPPEFIETPTVANKIYPTLRMAHRLTDIAVIYGGAGVSKTFCCEEYAKRENNVYMITMSSVIKSGAGCLEEIADTLGIQDVKRGGRRFSRAIIRQLRGTRGLLIIDEAQHLAKEALEAIRHIHDMAKIGVVFVGNETVYARFSAGGRRSAEFAQLFSRIGKPLRLTKPAAHDCYTIAETFQVKLSKPVKNLIKRIGETPGGLRGLVKTLTLAGIYAKGDRAAITEALINKAWGEITGTADNEEAA